VTIVLVDDLTKSFGPLVAVNRVSFSVDRGRIFGIVGPDGAGKTTTLRMLCGLVEPTAGRAAILGFDSARQTIEVKDHIGYMAQRFGLYLGLTVQENMDFYADIFGISKRDREDLGGRLLAMTRMEPFRDRLAAQLSGGMKQKLGLMCSLLHKPDVLFLDEPTNGVDPVSRRDFWAILHELVKQGLTVVVTTAYLDEAERCNQVALMHEGRIIRSGNPRKLRESIEEACYEIRTADNRRARSILKNLEGILTVTLAGDSLHVFADASHPEERLRQVLRDAGCEPVDSSVIVPTLEDVFIALIEKETGAAANLTPKPA
jgi:ABC-2 type transport system ATP-binding protein